MNKGREEYQVCSSCFSTTEHPGRVIDQNGKCNLCNSHVFEEKLSRQVFSDISGLRAVAKRIKEKNTGQYDCIIGASGGFDSSYIIYAAKRLLDLNPLVVKYDHGFNYEIADENLKTICQNLNVDLKIIKSRKQFDRKYIKFQVLALRKLDTYLGLCRFCRWVGPALVLREARKNGIHFCLTAVNLFEDVPSIPRKVKFKFMLNQLFRGNPLKVFCVLFFWTIADYYLLRFKFEFYLPPVRNLWRYVPRSKTVEIVELTRYLKWDIYGMAETLSKETGWKCPNPALPMRFDCQIEDSLYNYALKKATGNTSHATICNNLIYAKIRKKDQLRSVVEHYDRILDERMKDIMRRLGIKKTC